MELLLEKEWKIVEYTFTALLDDPGPEAMHKPYSIKNACRAICTLSMLGINTEKRLRKILLQLLQNDVEKAGLTKMAQNSEERYIREWTRMYKKYRLFLDAAQHMEMSSPSHSFTKTGESSILAESIFKHKHFFLNRPTNALTKACYTVLFRLLRKNKRGLVSVIRKIIDSCSEYERNLTFLMELIQILGEFGLRNKTLKKVEEDVVKMAISRMKTEVFEANRNSSLFKQMISFLSDFISPFPSNFGSRVETAVLNDTFETSISSIDFTSVNDAKYIYSVFSKAGKTEHLLRLYLDFLEASMLLPDTDSPGEFFNFHYKFLLNKEIVPKEFSDPAITAKVNDYYSLLLDNDQIVHAISWWVDILMKYAYNPAGSAALHLEKAVNCIRSNHAYIHALESEVEYATKIMKRVLVTGRVDKHFKSNEEQKEGEETTGNLRDVASSTIHRDIYDDRYLIGLFKKALFAAIPQFIQLAKHPERIPESLQLLLSFRLLNGHFDVRNESNLLSHLSPLHSEKMARMITDASNNDGIMLIRMCKWPMFRNASVAAPESEFAKPLFPFAAYKTMTEERLHQEEKNVRWFDALSTVRVKINETIMEMTLYQYSMVLKVCGNEGLNRPRSCLEPQFNLLIGKGLLFERDDTYVLNENCVCESFLPETYELLGKDASDQVPEGQMDRRSMIMARIARIMKKEKRKERNELKESVQINVFDECIERLIEKGILEVQGEYLLYIP